MMLDSVNPPTMHLAKQVNLVKNNSPKNLKKFKDADRKFIAARLLDQG